jgi:hypothetical protein
MTQSFDHGLLFDRSFIFLGFRDVAPPYLVGDKALE